MRVVEWLSESNVIVVVFHVSCDVLDDLDEWRKLDVLMVGDAFGFENNEIIHRRKVGVEFKELPLPDETLSVLVDSVPVWVCLLQQRVVQVV